MIFGEYSCLKENIFSIENCKIMPVRYEDRHEIMRWRNDQITILRQEDVLTTAKQNTYFNKVVQPTFLDDSPSQLLFSFFEDDQLIGYGGLVHLDWKSRNGEISFLLKTSLNTKEYYIEKFTVFLELIYLLAQSMEFHKIYTFGYDTEKYRFLPLINLSFNKEVVMKSQKKINGKYHDVLIYSKFIKETTNFKFPSSKGEN